MESGEVTPVISMRMRQHNGCDFGKIEMMLERSEAAGAKVNEDVRSPVLNEITAARTFSSRVTP